MKKKDPRLLANLRRFHAQVDPWKEHTQREIAAGVGCSQMAICKIERRALAAIRGQMLGLKHERAGTFE